MGLEAGMRAVGKKEEKGYRREKGGKGSGRDLPDQCQTGSYAPGQSIVHAHQVSSDSAAISNHCQNRHPCMEMSASAYLLELCAPMEMTPHVRRITVTVHID